MLHVQTPNLLADVSNDKIHKDLMEFVIKPVVPAKYLDDKTIFHLNPSGRYWHATFVVYASCHGSHGLQSIQWPLMSCTSVAAALQLHMQLL